MLGPINFAVAALLVLTSAHAAAQVRCVMPNGVVITQRLGSCPADATEWVEGQPKPSKPKPAARPAPPQAKPDARGRLPVSRATWGAEWPFSLPSGTLQCMNEPVGGGKTVQLVVFHGNDGATYAVNGAASSRGQRHGWYQAGAIWLPTPEIPGTRIPMGDVIARGLALCRP